MQRGSAAIFTQLIVLVSLLLTGTRAAPGDDDSPADQPTVGQPDTSTAPTDAFASRETSHPADAGGAPVMERVDTRPSGRRTRLVYACRDAATPVFSDRPCGASAHAWRLDLPQATAGAAPSTRAAAPAAATRPIVARASRRDVAEPADPCVRLEQQLATIDARMRNGYSAREAARLWQRWRDAKAKLRAADC
jgi:hypothetical protein